MKVHLLLNNLVYSSSICKQPAGILPQKRTNHSLHQLRVWKPDIKKTLGASSVNAHGQLAVSTRHTLAAVSVGQQIAKCGFYFIFFFAESADKAINARMFDWKHWLSQPTDRKGDRNSIVIFMLCVQCNDRGVMMYGKFTCTVEIQ